eukprot:351735-Chlamydomonas_euryale.AAC.3
MLWVSAACRARAEHMLPSCVCNLVVWDVHTRWVTRSPPSLTACMPDCASHVTPCLSVRGWAALRGGQKQICAVCIFHNGNSPRGHVP